MRNFLFILLTLLSTITATHAQINEELQNLLQDKLEEYKNQSGAVGLSVAIQTEDDVWKSAIGKDTAIKDLNTSSILALGSVSKTIISATILNMYEEGLLDLDDAIGGYLEDYEYIDAHITIRQLLNHTSGIYNYTDEPTFFNHVILNHQDIIMPEYILNTFVRASIFEAGTAWSYSNTNYLLLGMIIESIGGKAYYTEANERFDFDTQYPTLSMPIFESDITDLAHLWGDMTGVGLPPTDLQAGGLSMNALFSTAGAAGGYISTPSDLAKWAYDLYSGKLLSANSMEELTAVTPLSGNYGLGVILGVLPCENDVVGHTGGIFYTSATFYDTTTKIAVSTHCNDAENGDVVSDLAVDLLCIYSDYLATNTDEKGITEASVNVFPNPSHEHANITYHLPKEAEVSLMLVNELGAITYQLPPIRKQQGNYQLDLPNDLAAGIYYLQANIGGEKIVKKMIRF